MKRLFKLCLVVFLMMSFSMIIVVKATGKVNYTKGTIESNTEVVETDVASIATLYQSTFKTYNGGNVSPEKLSEHTCHWVELDASITSGYARLVQYNAGTTFNWTGNKPSVLAKKFEILNKGLMVLAGTNGDFFHIDDNCEPQGTAMQEGDFVKPYDDNTQGHQALGFKLDGSYIYGVPKISSNEYVKVLNSDGNYEEVKEIAKVDPSALSETGINLVSRYPYTLNKYSSNNIKAQDLPFDFKDYKVVTITYTQERYDRNTKKVFVKGTITAIDTDVQTFVMDDTKSNTFLASKDGSLDSLKVGDSVKCECSLKDEWKDVINIVSAYNQVLKDGQVVKYEGSGDWNTGYVNCVKNRTIWGFKADGSPVMMVAEKNGSFGCHYEECGEILKAVGCVQGFLFDGGGSSDLFVRNGDNKYKAINKQEDGGERSDANAIMLVCKNPGYSIEIKENGTSAIFKLVINNEDLFKEVKSVNITCNGSTKNLVDGDLTVTGLTPNSKVSYNESYEITTFADETKYVNVNKKEQTFNTTEEKEFVAPSVTFEVSDITKNSFKVTMAENEKVINDLDYDEEWDMTEDEVMFRFQEAVRIAKEVAKIKGNPTCEYDDEKKMAYLLYPDGHREYPTIED